LRRYRHWARSPQGGGGAWPAQYLRQLDSGRSRERVLLRLPRWCAEHLPLL